MSDEQKSTLYYCPDCKGTTRHTGTQSTATCNKCGSIKHIKKKSPAVAKLESLLAKALGIMEETDQPKSFKPNGPAKKSAEGAHRRDPGVKFHELRFDDQFQHKANPKTIRP